MRRRLDGQRLRDRTEAGAMPCRRASLDGSWDTLSTLTSHGSCRLWTSMRSPEAGSAEVGLLSGDHRPLKTDVRGAGARSTPA
jgi:hypothetical protein